MHSDCSSHVIHDICGRLSPNDGIAYVYFDYNDMGPHNIDQVVRCLLRQLLPRLNIVPPKIEALYNDSALRGVAPDTESFKQQLISITSQFNCVYTVFDALDACFEESFIGVIDLIDELSNANVRILCSSRVKHSELLTQLHSPICIEIKARPDDVERYLFSRLSREWIDDDEPRMQILETLKANAAGKYATSIHF